jgi:ribokinase
MERITVIGSINIDLQVKTQRLPKIGETIFGDGVSLSPGGKGANQAVAIARLGETVSMIGCVGKDSFGDILIENLSINGVDTKHVHINKTCTSGMAIIMVCDGDNCIIVDPGANEKLGIEAIDHAESLIAESEIVVLQLEIPLPVVKYAMQVAKKHGRFVILNPAPAIPLDIEILQMADLITPNEIESGILTGVSIENYLDAIEAAKKLRIAGANTVITTLGPKGAMIFDGNDPILIPANQVAAVDSTAAGDTFTAALAVSLIQNKPLIDAVRYATAAAAITVTRFGAQSSLPTKEEVNDMLNG